MTLLVIGKDGRALDAKSIWRTSFEELVKSDSGIGDEIRRYQDVLQYASSKVNFNVGEGVYMLPSNMVLLMGNETRVQQQDPSILSMASKSV